MNPRTESLWLPPSEAPSAPALARDLEADVAVIGAGITGLTAALALAEAGVRVVVLEARTIGSGVTGWTTAHVTEAVDARYTTIADRFGKEAARLVALSSRMAMEHIADRVGQLGIACDLRRVPGYLYTENAADRDELVAEQRAATDAGLSVDLDPELRLPFIVAGALGFRDQLRFDAHAYCVGLAKELRRRGVEIFEHTRVVEITDGEPVTLTTEQGHTVRVGAAFCATHAPLNRIFLQTKLIHYQSYAAAFKDPAGVEDALYWDTVDPYHYLRCATVRGERYLIVGGEDHKTGEEDHTEIPFERLLAYSRARFGSDRPAYHWSGQVIESIDGLPLLGRNSGSKHVYIATAFGGNGMTFGTVGALLVAELIRGGDAPWASLYDSTRMRLSSVGALISENAHVAKHLVADRFATAEVKSTRDIERGQGRTLHADGKRLAVYRDPKGILHAVAAKCTHMGCAVHFNDAERSWDCPCHGSRFGIDGSVIDGPAMLPLASHALDEDTRDDDASFAAPALVS